MSNMAELFWRFNEDEDGAPEMSTVMIAAVVVIPIVILLIFFGRQLGELIKTAWKSLTGTQPVQPGF